MKKIITVFVGFLIFINSNGQTNPPSTLFEGVITYEYQIKNPNSKLISDEEFYRELPNKGKSVYKMYIKGNQYRIDYPNRTEVYQPSSRRVMIYPNDKNEDSFHFVQADLVEDKMEKIEISDKKENVLSYSCSSIVTKNKWDLKTFFYNSQVLKASPSQWKSHLKDDLGPFIAMSSCFPLKIEGKGPFGNYTIKAIRIENKVLTKEIFEKVKGKSFYDDALPSNILEEESLKDNVSAPSSIKIEK